MNKTDKIIIRVEKATKNKLIKVAKASSRTMSDYIRLLIQKAAEENIRL